MPRPVTARRPDSLFDNRFRYDYIYPRGRSGETLRAYDTQDNDRPVVIKRPALQDAPPIRAGQQVSIMAEKRALEALSGHPVLTELLYTGTFRVGGQAHTYIVMEMATGRTVEEMILELGRRGARLPDLEMLILLDGLLDLLQAAHDKHIIYNDVDAKHLFWDRENYILKVIDWGNAVFTDGDHGPSTGGTHVTRAADVVQTGQLLYFLLSGGQRIDSSRPDPADELGEDVPARLKAIINRAVSTDAANRYPDLAALRHDLAEVRRPLQKQREALVERAKNRLPGAGSQSQLEELRAILNEALTLDPGFPPAREMLAEADRRLRKLSIQGDLDAVRIYIETGSPARAAALIDELADRAGEDVGPLLSFLKEMCAELGSVIPDGLPPALDALLRDDAPAAARTLLTTSDPRAAGRQQAALIAERLSHYMPGVTVLRPHLTRLDTLIGGTAEGATARDILARLEEPPTPGLQNLIRYYQRAAYGLAGLEQALTPIGGEALTQAARARAAAENILDLTEVIAQNALGDPSRAGNALWHASSIDPVNPAFEALNNALNGFHADLETLRGYVPTPEGSDIAEFLAAAGRRLRPYAAEITDGRFQAILRDLDSAGGAWARVMDCIALGGRRPAIDAAKSAAGSVRPLNTAVARWFEDYARRIDEAPHVESLSPNTAFGKAVSDGWEAWDRGRSGDGLMAGKRAVDLAVTEAEKLAARRLIGLSEALEAWLDNDGAASAPVTEAASRRVSALYLPDEETIRQRFASQMPSMQTYLRAMLKGIVEPLRDSSAAAIRVLFLDYVLRGIAALHKEDFEEANTWKEAAAKALGNARLHPAYQSLDTAIARRTLILEAVNTLNQTRNVAGIAEAKQAVRAPLAAAQLEHADHAVRALEDALRRWHDGDFRAARTLLDQALERAAAAEVSLGKPLNVFKGWLQELADSAEILAQARRLIEQEALNPAERPNLEIEDAHEKMVDVTRRDLGEPYTALLRQWRDTYDAFREAYTDPSLSKDEKLRIFESHFASLFIDRQPALPILRRWRELIAAQPDPEPTPPPAPSGVTDAMPAFTFTPPEPEPPTRARPERAERSTRGAAFTAPEPDDMSDPVAPMTDDPIAMERVGERRAAGKRPPLALIVGIVGLIALIGIGALILSGRGGAESGTPGATLIDPTPGAGGAFTEPTNTLLPPSATPTDTPPPTETPLPTLPPTATNTPEPGAPTPSLIPTGELIAPGTLVSALTPTTIPTLSAGASPEPTRAGALLPTVPPEAAFGRYDLLSPLAKLPDAARSWSREWFAVRDGKWQVSNPAAAGIRAPLVRLGPEILTLTLWVNAARYLQRVEAQVDLVQYNPALIPTGGVYFGVGLESVQGQRAAVEGRLVGQNVLDLGMNLNGRFQKKTQLPVTTPSLKIVIERRGDRTLALFVDGQLLGTSNAAYAPDVPLTIYLYTSTGDVQMNVNTLTVELGQPE